MVSRVNVFVPGRSKESFTAVTTTPVLITLAWAKLLLVVVGNSGIYLGPVTISRLANSLFL